MAESTQNDKLAFHFVSNCHGDRTHVILPLGLAKELITNETVLRWCQNLGEAIRVAREARGLTQQDLAREITLTQKIECAPTTISLVESFEHHWRCALAAAICLGIDMPAMPVTQAERT